MARQASLEAAMIAEGEGIKHVPPTVRSPSLQLAMKRLSEQQFMAGT